MQTVSGRLQDQQLGSADRNFAMWMHVSVLLAFCVVWMFAGIAPLILWLSRRDRSPFIDDHGREVVNMSITGLLLLMLTGPLWIIWAIVILIGLVRGANAAHGGEFFRYPMTFRL